MGKPRKRSERNESNLVPGQGQPPSLEALRSKLIAPTAASAGAPARPRRFHRAGYAWAGVMALGAALSGSALLVFLGAAPAVGAFIRPHPAPAAPDRGLAPELAAGLWDRAGYDAAGFQSALGVPQGDPSRMEADARRLERLLSRRAHPGLE